MELVALINSGRKSRGLVELQFDQALARCARGHSRHYYEHSFFMGHVNPEGDDFTDRLNNNGVDTESAAENISYNLYPVSPQAVWNGWLDSPGHNENMHYYCFIRIGVGRHQNVWTALFAR